MSKSLKSTAMAILRRSRFAALVVSAGILLVGVLLVSPDAYGATPVRANDDDCFDFSEYLPDGVTIDGCWECDISPRLDWSFWCLDVTITCSSVDPETGEDATVTITLGDYFGLCGDQVPSVSVDRVNPGRPRLVVPIPR